MPRVSIAICWEVKEHTDLKRLMFEPGAVVVEAGASATAGAGEDDGAGSGWAGTGTGSGADADEVAGAVL